VNKRKLLARVRNNPRDVRFSDATLLAEAFGFALDRQKGSHRVYAHPDVPDMLNLQPDKVGKAKAYHIRQLLDLADSNDLSLDDAGDDDA